MFFFILFIHSYIFFSVSKNLMSFFLNFVNLTKCTERMDQLCMSNTDVQNYLIKREERGCCCHDRMVVGFTTICPITTNVLSSNSVHSEMYSIQHYVIRFDITEILLKVVLSTVTPFPFKREELSKFLKILIHE